MQQKRGKMTPYQYDGGKNAVHRLQLQDRGFFFISGIQTFNDV